MKTKLSIIKADIGSIGGRIRPNEKLVAEVRNYYLATEGNGIISDFVIGQAGDEIVILFPYSPGKEREKIYQLVWTAFAAGKVVRKQGLHGKLIMREKTLNKVKNSKILDLIRTCGLSRKVEPSRFSPPALAMMREKIGEYGDRLLSESVDISRRCGTDCVSEIHVQEAARYLVGNLDGRISRHLGTIGGIVLGSSLSAILGMIIIEQYPSVGILLSVSLCITGAFMIALGIARK